MARLVESLETLRRQVDELAPDRDRSHDGWIGDSAHQARKSDHNPDPDGTVDAVDITHDPAAGADMHAIAEEVKEDGRVKYLIFARRIWNPSVSRSWRPYGGSNPHETHMHVSVRDGRQDDASLWPIGIKEDDVSKTVTPIAQRLVMRPDMPGRGLLLDCLGGIHSVGGQPVPAGAPYWGGSWDLKMGPVAVDLAVADWDGPQGVPTGWTVDCKGALHPWAGTAATSGPYWVWSPAVAELD